MGSRTICSRYEIFNFNCHRNFFASLCNCCYTLTLFQSSVPEEKKEILQSDTDATEWKLEVERVTPSLKITIRQDAKVPF